jgi:DNA-binding NarL/FixJ family response regulator
MPGTDTKKINLYIVDDHQIMIDGIKALLKTTTQFAVAGQNTNPVRALEELKRQNVDILITDINMNDMSGIELTKKVRQVLPDLKVLALSMYGDRETISEMLEAGINGYVLKNTGMEELVTALNKISNGQLYFSDEVSAEMMKAITQPRQEQKEKETINLTAREIEIVKLISEELSNAQIGEKLFISERTVETHRKNIFRKTNTKSVAGLIKYAIEHKVI